MTRLVQQHSQIAFNADCIAKDERTPGFGIGRAVGAGAFALAIFKVEQPFGNHRVEIMSCPRIHRVEHCRRLPLEFVHCLEGFKRGLAEWVYG